MRTTQRQRDLINAGKAMLAGDGEGREYFVVEEGPGLFVAYDGDGGEVASYATLKDLEEDLGIV